MRRKTSMIVNKDDREDVFLEISDEEFIILAKEAHRMDITFNKYIEHLIMKYIEETENAN